MTINTDPKITTDLIEWLYLYLCITDVEHDTYISNINNNIPFSVGYFINGKLKYVSYLQEDPIDN